MSYNFKGIHPILPAKEMINVVLSKTQRKTPTVVHPGYEIGRIRGFYMRKVKFTQDTIHEKLDSALKDFPRLEDLHPFFADLMNVLYDRDHYKLALGHVSACKNVIDNIAKDYVRLLKYADSLYRCKMLKRAALGRMCTSIKKLSASLDYLEEVRKHLARMPSINPFERTLLITGFPNVGKSSFVNNITNANLDVQPYPFTTQNLYVGHTDYNFVRWQVIDTPGVLDKPLEQRTTIEMQAITALAHLKACVVFFIDISETCSYSIDQQIGLYQDLKPLFKNKKVLFVFSKIDLKRIEELDPIDQQKLQALLQEENVAGIQMSNKSGDGVADVKREACELLLKYRIETQNDQNTGGSSVLKQEEDFLKGIYVAQPKFQRGNRPPSIPEVIQRGEKPSLNRPTLREIQEQQGGAGVFNFPKQEHFLLENPDWKYDVVPEIMDGKNIADFVDADILQRLEELEREEEMLANEQGIEEEDEYNEELEQLKEVRQDILSKKKLLQEDRKFRMKSEVALHRPTIEDVKEKLSKKGVDTTFMEERLNRQLEKNKKNTRTLSQKRAIQTQVKQQHDMESEDDLQDERQRSRSRVRGKLNDLSRSRSIGARKTLTQQEEAMERAFKKVQRDRRNEAKAGEGDRRILNMMPKHLYSGKQSNGKRSRR